MFITFEGLDGSGKSTQVERTAQWLRDNGHEVVVSREPGATDLGKEIREILLHGGKMNPKTEALLYAADRAHHVETVVKPALREGKTVIIDRYIDSSVAYQGFGRELGPDHVRRLSAWATDHLTPELTFLLDVTCDVAMERLGHDLDRMESEGKEFFRTVRKGFLEISAQSDHFWLVDATLSEDEVFEQIEEGLVSHIGAR